MSSFTLFCPQCDSLLIDLATHQALNVCACGWARPASTGVVGEKLGEPLALHAKIKLDAVGVVAGERLWLAATAAEQGLLLGASLKEWGDVKRLTLEADTQANDLAGDGDHVFATMNCIEMPNTPKHLAAYHGSTGDEAWRQPTEFRALSSAVYQNDLICFAGEGSLFVLQASTQTLRQVNVGASVVVSPTFAGQAVVVAGKYNERVLRAFAVDDARPAWTYAGEQGELSRALLCGTPYAVYAVVDRKFLHALNAHDGKLLWTYIPERKTAHSYITSAPVARGDRVYFGCGDYFEKNAGRALRVHQAQGGELLWRAQLPGHLRVRVGVLDDLIVCADDTGLVLGLFRDGVELWRAELGRAAASAPLFFGDAVYIADDAGNLHILRARPPQTPPQEPPAVYEARGDWGMAAVAHALSASPDHLNLAAQALAHRGDHVHAQKLFELAGEAIQSDLQLALIALDGGDYRRAADLYYQHDRWADAATAYERAGEANDLIKAARICIEHLHDSARAMSLYQRAAVLLENEKPDRAWIIFRRADINDRAKICFDRAWQHALQEKDEAQAAQLCRTWAEVEIELLGKHAIGNQEVAQHLETAADYYSLANDPQTALACRELAAQIMETPRFHLQITAPEGARFIENKSTQVQVALTNVGYGAAKQVTVRLAGDVEDPIAHTFNDLHLKQPQRWDTARVIPKHEGKVILKIEIEYLSYRVAQRGKVEEEYPLDAEADGLLSAVGRAVKRGGSVQLNIEKYVAPGATNNELNVHDSAVIVRAPLFADGATTATIGGDVIGRDKTINITNSVVISGAPKLCVHCGSVGKAGEDFCSTCGGKL
jgi:outer membrane protein assembly factor BamB